MHQGHGAQPTLQCFSLYSISEGWVTPHCSNSSKMKTHQIPIGNKRLFRKFILILNWYLPTYKNVYPLESTATSRYWVLRHHAIYICCLLLCSHVHNITEQVLLSVPSCYASFALDFLRTVCRLKYFYSSLLGRHLQGGPGLESVPRFPLPVVIHMHHITLNYSSKF